MFKRMPIQWSGRDIHLMKCRAKTGLEAPKVWKVITSKRGDGKWWSIVDTRNVGVEPLRVLTRIIRKRMSRHGLHAVDLMLFSTEIDGICFRWRYVNPVEAKEAEKKIKERSERFTEVRNIQQRAWRQAIRDAKKQAKEVVG